MSVVVADGGFLTVDGGLLVVEGPKGEPGPKGEKGDPGGLPTCSTGQTIRFQGGAWTCTDWPATGAGNEARLLKLERRWYVDNSATDVDSSTARGVWRDHGDVVSGITTVLGDVIALRYTALFFSDDVGNGDGSVRVTVDGVVVKRWTVNVAAPADGTIRLGRTTSAGKINLLSTTPNGLVASGGSSASMDPAAETGPMVLGTDDNSAYFRSHGAPMLIRVAPGTHTVAIEYYAEISPSGNYHLRKRRLWVSVIPGPL